MRCWRIYGVGLHLKHNLLIKNPIAMYKLQIHHSDPSQKWEGPTGVTRLSGFAQLRRAPYSLVHGTPCLTPVCCNHPILAKL